jgi:hypothetical protein
LSDTSSLGATAGRRFRTFFTAVCIDIRNQTRASEARAADLVGVGENSIRRFEEGKVFPHANLEAYAAGYAQLLEPRIDPRDLFDRAIEWWREAGKAPFSGADLRQQDNTREPTPADVIVAIRRAEQARVSADAQPSGTRRRRTGVG